jgi:DNA-binding NarL/FixJ family response regulator
VNEQPQVTLIEDEPVARASIRRVLERSGFSVEGEATAADEGIDLALRVRPEICLIDVSIPGGGIRAAREIARRLPETAVVMLSASSDHSDVADSIRAGAAGYLLKGMNPDRIAHALRGVLEGEAAIPRSLMAHLVKDLQTQGRRRLIAGRNGRAELTSREWEVLELMCDGLSGPEIAERLSISRVTVRRHASQVVKKLGVRDRAEAVALVQQRSQS